MMRHVHIHITGIVQGVGMRPFVYRAAVARGVTGWVLNAGDGVHIEAEAEERALDAFLRALRDEAPAAARIDGIEVTECTDGSGPDTPRGAAPADPAPEFRIIASDDETERTTLVSPDIATCPDCLRELFDPTDRRFHYPFINCTNCGPRFTIIRALPYDRPATSMGAFPMCAACAAEYADPADRRFHAQPDACFDCGPHITWRERTGATGTEENVPAVGATRAASDAIIERCARLLEAGGIVAVKGLGGFHLACNAADEKAVRELRRRKRRSNKPLAVMMRSVEDVQRLCLVDDTERGLLTGSIRPIVLLRRRTSDNGGGYVCQTAGSEDGRHSLGKGAHGPQGGEQGSEHGVRLVPSVAFGLPELGVMLPYTPLQHLLLAACAEHGMHALVMTSGNLSDEPIEIDDARAWEDLVESGLADALLGNDRAILARYDDSVVRVVDGIERPVRRARGYAPQPLALPAHGKGANVLAAQVGTDTKANPQARSASTARDARAGTSSDPAANADISSIPTILACGSEQKATLAFTRERPDGRAQCFLSQHIGDVENAETFEAWHEARRRLASLFDLHEGALACDLHPQYLASQWARGEAVARGLPLIEVQHHHAHIASVIAEAAARGELDPAQPVIGIALDGTGAGTDGTVWGGEILIATLGGYERAGHLKPWRLPGGAASVRDARRNAYSLLSACDLLDHPGARALVESLDENERSVTATMIERGLNSPLTSSMGRLLDAAAALLGICPRATYEGEPAIELEAAASRTHGAADVQQHCRYRFDLHACPAHTPDGPVLQRMRRVGERAADEYIELDPTPMLRSALDDVAAGRAVDAVAADMHRAVARAVCETTALLARRTGIRDVALSGGVFMNRLLLGKVARRLRAEGLRPLVPGTVPVNDGCIAYGQAAVARARLHAR